MYAEQYLQHFIHKENIKGIIAGESEKQKLTE